MHKVIASSIHNLNEKRVEELLRDLDEPIPATSAVAEQNRKSVRTNPTYMDEERQRKFQVEVMSLKNHLYEYRVIKKFEHIDSSLFN